ncbi:MAG: sensor histidine kinase, partial [Spirochaetota bacterium]
MMWMIANQTASLISALFLACIFLYIYSQDRREYLFIWVVCWFLHGLRFLSGILGQVTGFAAVFDVAYHSFSVAGSFFLLYGCYLLSGRKISGIWKYLTALILIWIFVSIPMKLDFAVITVPVYFFIAAVHFLSGVLILKSRFLNTFAKYLVSVTLILWGVHFADYPFLRPFPDAAPFGYMAGFIFKITLAVGFLLLYFYQARCELALEREKFRFLAENTTDVISSMNLYGNLTYMSPSVSRHTGYSESERVKMPLDQRMTEESKELMLQKMSAIAGKVECGQTKNLSEQFDILVYTASGAAVWTEVILDPVINADGKIESFISVSRNIGERKKAEDALKTALKEKEILLQEIHHRVKNNMQIIISLLNMQKNQISDETLKAHFSEAQSRIRAMAMVHEVLYKSGNFSQIDF